MSREGNALLCEPRRRFLWKVVARPGAERKDADENATAKELVGYDERG